MKKRVLETIAATIIILAFICLLGAAEPLANLIFN